MKSAQQEARVVQLDATQQTLLADAKKGLVAETARLRKALQVTGINPQSMLKRVSQGGPLMTMAPTMQDDAFRAGVVDTTASLNDLAMVVKALNSVPLDGPLGDERGEQRLRRSRPIPSPRKRHSTPESISPPRKVLMFSQRRRELLCLQARAAPMVIQ